MKIALAQLNYHVGNFESNTEKIIDHIFTVQNCRELTWSFSPNCAVRVPGPRFFGVQGVYSVFVRKRRENDKQRHARV